MGNDQLTLYSNMTFTIMVDSVYCYFNLLGKTT